MKAVTTMPRIRTKTLPPLNEFDTPISRRQLLRCALGLGGLAFASALASQLNITPAEAAVDLTKATGFGTFVGGNAELMCGEIEGVTVICGNVTERYGDPTLAGRVLWGLDEWVTIEQTTLAIGGAYTHGAFRSTVGASSRGWGNTGGNARIGGTVCGSAAIASDGESAGPGDRGLFVGTAEEMHKHWPDQPVPNRANCEAGPTIKTNLGKAAALQVTMLDGSTVDAQQFWANEVAPLITHLRSLSATGTVAFSAEPAYTADPGSTDHQSITRSGDTRVTCTGDGTSTLQIFDLYASDIANKQICLAINNVPHETGLGFYVIRVHGTNPQVTYGYKSYLNGADYSGEMTAAYNNDTYRHFQDLCSRVLWLYDDNCGTMRVNRAHAMCNGYDVYVADDDCWAFNASNEGGLSSANLMPGSHIVPASAHVRGSTNGRLWVRDNLQLFTWEHHATTWLGLEYAQLDLTKEAKHSDWL